MISKGERYVAFVGLGVEPEEDIEFSRHTTLRAGKGVIESASKFASE